jgi:predicted NUDIX family NTP pyrophosphohydrolase
MKLKTCSERETFLACRRPPIMTRVARRSAGIVLYRGSGPELQVLLVHPGGPLWARRDAGAWSIPKGEYEDGEEPAAAARREFAEELGSPAPDGELTDLGEVRQRSGKLVRGWAASGDLDADAITSNTFTLEWPPRSGRMGEFPEVDRAQWFTLEEARERINPGQVALLDRLERGLG